MYRINSSNHLNIFSEDLVIYIKTSKKTSSGEKKTRPTIYEIVHIVAPFYVYYIKYFTVKKVKLYLD